MIPRAWSFVVLAAAAMPALGQGVEIDVVSTATTHVQIGEALMGLGIAGRPLRAGRAALRLGAEYSGSTSSSLRSTCYGLINPAITDCSPKPMQDRGRLFMATTGLELRAFAVGPLSMGVFGDVGVGRLSLATRQQSGTWGAASAKTVLNALAGATLHLRMPEGWSLRASAARGSIAPWTTEYVIDGYSPFDGEFGTRRLSIGVMWGPRQP